jgi:phospholipid/cholesterol/gamma-HCH transport system substrate-binding protein
MPSRMESLPEAERARAHPPKGWRPSNALVGLLFLLAALIGLYLGYTKHLPGTGYGYELKAVFADGSNLPPDAPVRIAGVNVGRVIETTSDGENAVVRFDVDDEGRPVHADAIATSRPRIFLEGNNFIELDPGSPSARELESGETIPVAHTSRSVQLDEITAALDEPVRDDLRVVLQEYGAALEHEPTPAEDRTQRPSVKGETASKALNEAFDYGGKATRSGARVAEAFQGTEPRDLSKLIAGSARTFEAFARRDRELRELVTNWNRFTGALAAESTSLRQTVAGLEPTLQTAQTSLRNLDESLPPLRQFSLAMAGSLPKLPGAIEASGPWLDQARLALRDSEAGGVARLVRKATPGLAGASENGIGTIREISLLSRCASEVLIPTGDQVLGGPFSIGQPNSREFFYATVNIGSESQSFDGNGPYLRVQTGGGDVFASVDNPIPNPSPGSKPDDKLWANLSSPPLGTQPQLGGLPPFKAKVKCFKNDVPDLNAGLGQVGPPMLTLDTPPGVSP